MGRSVILFAFLILAVTAGFAASDDCSAESFTYDPVTDVLTVDSDVPDRTSGFGWDPFLDGCREIVVSEGVGSIGCGSFSGCSSAVSITLPSTLTHVGGDAFAGCVSLVRLDVRADGLLPDDGAFRDAGTSGPGVKVTYGPAVRTVCRLFHGGERIASVDLGHAERISDRALYGIGTASLTIPDTVTYIGDLALFGCTGLDVLELPYGLTHIGKDAFYGCSGLSRIVFGCGMCGDLDPKGAFGHTGGPDLVFSDGCGYVPSNLMIGMHPSSVTFSDSVRSIGDDAFRDYSGPVLELPDGLESIGARAFMGCDALESVVLSGSLAHIGASAFGDCRSLSAVGFSSSIGDIAASDAPFRGCCAEGMSVTVSGISRIPSNLFLGSTSLSSVVLGDGVVSIGDGALAFCESLRHIDLNDVSDIGDDAFLGCSSLTDVTVGSGSIVLGDDCFRGTALRSLVFGDCVIGDRAFKDVPLDSVRFDGGAAIGHGSFSGMPDGFVMEFRDGDISLDPSDFADAVSMRIVLACDTVPAGLLRDFQGVFEADILSYTIGDSAFRGCTGLYAIGLNDVTDIGAHAFEGCTSVTVLDIPGSVAVLGDMAFSGMTGLISLTVSHIPGSAWSEGPPFVGSGADGSVAEVLGDIPPRMFAGSHISSVTSRDAAVIGQHAFSDSSLSEFIPSDGLRIVGAGAFSGTSLTSVELIGGVTYHENAYADCTHLVHADVTSAVGIPDGMFSGCTSLSDIVMRYGLEGIGDRAFERTAIPSVQIPYSVSAVGAYAFRDCANLSHVTVLGHAVSIGDRAFSGCPIGIAELQSGNIPGSRMFDDSVTGTILIPDGDPGDLPYGASVYHGNATPLSSVTYDLSDLGLADIMLLPGTVPDADMISDDEITWVGPDGTVMDPAYAQANTVVYGMHSPASVSGGSDAIDSVPFDMLACIFALASALCMVLANFGKRSV